MGRRLVSACLLADVVALLPPKPAQPTKVRQQGRRCLGTAAPNPRPRAWETSVIGPLLVGFLMAGLPTVALAQPVVPRAEIAGGGMFSQTVAVDCDLGDGVILEGCSPRSKAWWISPAYHVTDRVALVGEISGRFLELKSTATGDDFFPFPGGLAVDATYDLYAFGGGIRVNWRGERFTPFTQALVSYGRANATISAAFLRESAVFTGILLEPSAGVDIHVAERIAVRVVGGYGAGWSEGELNQEIRIGAGVVFGFGSR